MKVDRRVMSDPLALPASVLSTIPASAYAVVGESGPSVGVEGGLPVAGKVPSRRHMLVGVDNVQGSERSSSRSLSDGSIPSRASSDTDSRDDHGSEVSGDKSVESLSGGHHHCATHELGDSCSFRRNGPVPSERQLDGS